MHITYTDSLLNSVSQTNEKNNNYNKMCAVLEIYGTGDDVL